ncbi:Hypothetical protein R9X50_00542500 [Acrodontium crateriforme]|uniref:Uncharacterized protein n=1 Tax=Acrodontium crateriforme TaxID=150365 RepID=A0AAQ3M745_9PEZI|nr:Hypothetical protein R9X50_00542500 [Acrodontium crateriforme]
MLSRGKADASIQNFLLPTPSNSPSKRDLSPAQSNVSYGDGFTEAEINEARTPKSIEPCYPTSEYLECEIRDLQPGHRAVTFMGRIANIFDVSNSPKTARSAKGCSKLCVKDETGAITVCSFLPSFGPPLTVEQVRFWYASRVPLLMLGSLISIWTTHISNGHHGALASSNAPLFASLFPERDRTCHLMVHENSDDGKINTKPLDYRLGQPLNGLMTLRNYIDGGYEVSNARVLVVVKSLGSKKRVTRKDESMVENVNVQIHDDSTEATLGLWGTVASSPFQQSGGIASTDGLAPTLKGWKTGETVLLLQGARCRISRTSYLTLSSSTIVDLNPSIPDADWLRRWSLRQKCREAINPPFPSEVFDRSYLETGPVRCLYTIAELDEFARAAPNETFQGYLSVVIAESKLHDSWKRQILFAGECCRIAIYANAPHATCKGCDATVELRLNPRVLGQVIDETGSITSGKLLFCDQAWLELFGRKPKDLPALHSDAVKALSDRLLFCRVNLMFGWTGDASKAGRRICVLGVRG